MGYRVVTIDNYVVVPAEKVAQAEDHARRNLPGMKEGESLEGMAHDYGFEDSSLDDGGNFLLGDYYGKSAGEIDFMDAIAPYVKDGSYLTWRGEDDEMWGDVFMGGRRWNLDVVIQFVPPKPSSIKHRDWESYQKLIAWIEKQTGVGDAT